MEEVAEIIKIYRIAFIDNLFVSLLFIKLFSRFFVKEAYLFSKQIICWLIIVSAAISILNWIMYILVADNSTLTNHATGPYAAIYWFLIFFSCIFPFILLFKKIRKNSWAISAILLLMNAGWMFERFVIIVTSLHRDYYASSWSESSPFTPILISIIHSLILAVIITIISIFIVIYKKANPHNAGIS